MSKNSQTIKICGRLNIVYQYQCKLKCLQSWKIIQEQIKDVGSHTTLKLHIGEILLTFSPWTKLMPYCSYIEANHEAQGSQIRQRLLNRLTPVTSLKRITRCNFSLYSSDVSTAASVKPPMGVRGPHAYVPWLRRIQWAVHWRNLWPCHFHWSIHL